MEEALFFAYKRLISSLLCETHKPTYTDTKKTEFFMGTGMGSSWWGFFFVLYIIHLLLINAACCFSLVQTQTHCHDDERSALLQFKASFTIDKSASQDPFAYAKVASWGRLEGDPQRSNCCSWDGVECNHHSGHVIGLDLASSYLHGSINSNSSLLQLVQLQRLDLSDNNFSYSQIPSRLGHDLNSLTYLNLSMSSFSGQIPSEISYLSKLSALDLSSSYESHLKMANFGSLIQNLTNIKQLHLSSVEIGSTVPSTLVNVSSLTSLRLQACDLEGQFPVGIFHLPNLQVLDLANNSVLNGYFPDELNKSSPLKILNLRSTNFSGHLPASIGDLRALNLLHISDCNFYPHVPSSLSNLTQLNFLDLSLFSKKGTFIGQVTDSWSWVGKLTRLNNLSLADTNLRGVFPCFLANLTQLVQLDLSFNQITGQIPSSLGNLRQLVSLSLSSNQITGEIPSSLANLKQLSALDLSSNQITGEIPSSLANMTQLVELDLSYNQITGEISSSLGNLTQLVSLSLSANQITGEIPCFLANLKQLSELVLYQNQITGQIPSCLGQLTQLTLLDVRFNNMQGTIPQSLFELRNLEDIYLNSCNLSGYVEFDEFSKLEKLRVLRLSYNKLSVHIKTGFTATPPKLQVLGLDSCNLTEFPEFLKYTSNLVALNLAENNLNGQIPKWMWNSASETLEYLNLSNNHLTGFEENPVIIPLPRLISLDLGSNMLQGSLPIPGPSMALFSVSNNQYAGEIPATFCKARDLYFLDLSNNNLNGMIPQCFENLTDLDTLKLQNNSFHGDIPRIGSKKCLYLEAIDLSYNQLQGKLPRSIANCSGLVFLNLGNNQISDTFPTWLGVLQQLRVLILRSNAFHGIIGKPASCHEFPKLSIIDLSSNDFSSMLPSDYLENWNAMKSVDANEQIYVQYTVIIGKIYTIALYYDYAITVFGKGVELKYFKTPYLLKLVDLSSNRFEGEIPGVIGNLRGLHFLSLSNNALTGPIPSSLGNLTALESLDLSQNQLSGKLPGDLGQMTFLSYFNVSHNRLSGSIPQGRQFDTFQEDMYQENSGLCGKPLPKKCEDSESTTPQTSFEQDEDSGFQIELDWFVVLPGVVAGLIVGVVGGNFWTTKKHDWFVETFSRRRQPRGIRQWRGLRT